MAPDMKQGLAVTPNHEVAWQHLNGGAIPNAGFRRGANVIRATERALEVLAEEKSTPSDK